MINFGSLSHGAVAAASAALGAVAAGAGEPGAALAIAVSGAFGAAAVAVAPREGDGRRWASVAAAVSVGLLPCAGISAGLVTVVATLLRRGAPGAVVVALVVVAVVLAALGARRSIDRAAHDGAPSRLLAASVLVATVAAVALGPVLAVGTRLFASAAPSLADRWMSSSVAWPPSVRLADGPSLLVSLLAVGLVTTAAAAGWRAGVPGSAVALVGVVDRGASLLVRTADALVSAVRVMVRGVVVIDHEVLEDAGRVVSGAFLRGASLVASTSPGAVFDRLGTGALARVGLDDPRTTRRLREVVTVLGVAIPVLLVLSSWLLG